jgi:large subunit ribosomal protein L10
MARPEKVEAVADITERFSSAEAALLAEYRGLSVTDMAEVRGALRDARADLKVLKNTLARIAVRAAGLEELVDMLQGPTAIAFCHGDAVEAAKALDDATRRFPVISVKGGVLAGRVLDASQARALATLGSRESQLATIALLMSSPTQRLANVLPALLRNLGSMLARVVEQKKETEAAPASGGAAE